MAESGRRRLWRQHRRQPCRRATRLIATSRRCGNCCESGERGIGSPFALPASSDPCTAQIKISSVPRIYATGINCTTADRNPRQAARLCHRHKHWSEPATRSAASPSRRIMPVKGASPMPASVYATGINGCVNPEPRRPAGVGAAACDAWGRVLHDEPLPRSPLSETAFMPLA